MRAGMLSAAIEKVLSLIYGAVKPFATLTTEIAAFMLNEFAL